jgi:ankyrin repeat protein
MKTYFMRWMKKFIYLIVFSGFMSAHAGSYEDFFAAIKQDNAVAIQNLLARGFDANTLDPKGQNGLYLALQEPSPKAAQALLAWPKTDVNVLNAQGESPLMIAALKDQRDLSAALIQRDADVNKTGWTPLHYAASRGNLAIMSLLLDNHAYIDAESPNGTTPLMMAAMYGSAAAVDLLLKEGADPLLKNQPGLTAIDFALRASRKEAADLIAAAVRAKQPKGTW